jgi:hypothetical protein
LQLGLNRIIEQDGGNRLSWGNEYATFGSTTEMMLNNYFGINQVNKEFFYQNRNGRRFSDEKTFKFK